MDLCLVRIYKLLKGPDVRQNFPKNFSRKIKVPIDLGDLFLNTFNPYRSDIHNTHLKGIKKDEIKSVRIYNPILDQIIGNC